MPRLLKLIARIPYVHELTDSRRPLAGVIPLVFAAVVLWQGLPAVVEGYRFRGTQDFLFLRQAGFVVQDEASALYSQVNAGEWEDKYDQKYPDWYPYPPAVAYLTIPFTLVEDEPAVFVLRVLIALSTLYLAITVARTFDSTGWRVAMGAAVVVWEPIVLNGRIGQTGMFVTLATALAANAYLRDRVGGAMIFGLLALKPSTILGPALAVSLSRPKVWPYFATVAAGVVFVPFVLLGPQAVGEWLRVLYERSAIDLGGGHRYNQGLSSFLDFRGIIGVLLLSLLAAGLFLSGRRVKAGLGIEIATAFAILVGFLLNPHSLLYDWGVAFVALYLFRRSPLVQGPYADFGIGLLGISLFVAGQLAWHWPSLTVNPLTVWALAVVISLLALSFVVKSREQDETLVTVAGIERPVTNPEPG